jgi:hypothetical protein
MLLLIPLLSGLSDRMDALRDTAHPKARAALNAVTDWIEAGGPRDEGLALVERLEALAAKRRNASWPALLVESLLMRWPRPSPPWARATP